MNDVKTHQQKVASAEGVNFLHINWFILINDDSPHL